MRRAADPSRTARRQGLLTRIGILFVVIAALIGPVTARGASEAGATASDEAAFVAGLNQVRADAGLPPFVVNSELSDLSRSHAQVMADAGEIFHASPISAGYTGPWSKIGENVGVGANVSVLVDAFVASPGHYANIIDPAFTEIGVGVVWRDNALYTTHRFLQVPGASPTTTTTTPPPTTTRPPRPFRVRSRRPAWPTARSRSPRLPSAPTASSPCSNCSSSSAPELLLSHSPAPRHP